MLKKIATQTVSPTKHSLKQSFVCNITKPKDTPKVRIFIDGGDELPVDDRENDKLYVRLPILEKTITLAMYIEVPNEDVWQDYTSVISVDNNKV